MSAVDPYLAEVRRRAGRMGGLAKAVAYADRPEEATRGMRDGWRRSFEEGTHACSLGCRPFTPPTDVRARQQAAQRAIDLHMARMRAHRGKEARA